MKSCVRSLRWRIPSAETNSVVRMSAPLFLAKLAENQVRHAGHRRKEKREIGTGGHQAASLADHGLFNNPATSRCTSSIWSSRKPGSTTTKVLARADVLVKKQLASGFLVLPGAGRAQQAFAFEHQREDVRGAGVLGKIFREETPQQPFGVGLGQSFRGGGGRGG